MIDSAITRLENAVKDQDCLGWYAFQNIPVAGGLLSIPVGVASGAYAIYHLAKAVFASTNARYINDPLLIHRTCRQYHLDCAADFAVMFLDHLLNVATAGVLNFGIDIYNTSKDTTKSPTTVPTEDLGTPLDCTIRENALKQLGFHDDFSRETKATDPEALKARYELMMREWDSKIEKLPEGPIKNTIQRLKRQTQQAYETLSSEIADSSPKGKITDVD